MKIIDIAVSQLGTAEKDLNEIKYNQWYYGRKISGGSYPYCAVFISWCAEQAKLSTNIIPKTASVRTMHDFFVSQNRFVDKSVVPNIGDILICRNGASHVALVETVDVAGVWVIEGVSGKGIVRTYYSYSNPTISGYAKPNYPEEIIHSGSKAANTNVNTAPELPAIKNRSALTAPSSLKASSGLTATSGDSKEKSSLKTTMTNLVAHARDFSHELATCV